jgi:hypothetical protein
MVNVLTSWATISFSKTNGVTVTACALWIPLGLQFTCKIQTHHEWQCIEAYSGTKVKGVHVTNKVPRHEDITGKSRYTVYRTVLNSDRFTPGEIPLGIHMTEGWMDLPAGLAAVANTKMSVHTWSRTNCRDTTVALKTTKPQTFRCTRSSNYFHLHFVKWSLYRKMLIWQGMSLNYATSTAEVTT